VKASIGHVMDLPKSKLGVDIENDFAAEYHVIQGKTSILADIKKAAKDKDNVYLASDPDREGEAIAWHIGEKLGTRRRRTSGASSSTRSRRRPCRRRSSSRGPRSPSL
jgi:DNA topoisomerase-1